MFHHFQRSNEDVSNLAIKSDRKTSNAETLDDELKMKDKEETTKMADVDENNPKMTDTKESADTKGDTPSVSFSEINADFVPDPSITRITPRKSNKVKVKAQNFGKGYIELVITKDNNSAGDAKVNGSSNYQMKGKKETIDLVGDPAKQTDPGYTGSGIAIEAFYIADGNKPEEKISAGKSNSFLVAAFPLKVENGPSSPFNGFDPNYGTKMAGMRIAIALKSDSEVDTDLDQVEDSEYNPNKIHIKGAYEDALKNEKVVDFNSYWMSALNIPPDEHYGNVGGLIYVADKYKEGGSFIIPQLDLFKDKRTGCGPVEIPYSGHWTKYKLIVGQGSPTHIQWIVSKEPHKTEIDAYTAKAGPSSNYSESNEIRA